MDPVVEVSVQHTTLSVGKTVASIQDRDEWTLSADEGQRVRR